MALRIGIAVFALVASVGSARAQDRFEIEVYEAEINEPLRPSLQLHLNYTVIGHTTPDYPGGTPTERASRFTLEPALGITEFLEVGGYLQTVYSPGNGFKYAGLKLRALFVVPRRLTGPFDVGLNLEVSYLPKAAEQDTWGCELRPIFGWRSKWVGIWINPIIDWSLSGSSKLRPEIQPALRVSVNTQHGAALGIEYYSGLGAFADGFLPARQQTHLLFAAFDLVEKPGDEPSPWSLNLGVGAGLTEGSPQRFILKAIVGRSF